MFLWKCQAILKIISVLYKTKYSITTLRICDIRLPVTVSNRLNAWQSEIFTEFRLKSSIKTYGKYSIFLQKSVPKNYFGFIFDEFTELHCRALSLFETVTDIIDTERCGYALHELGKFVLCKNEIIFKIA